VTARELPARKSGGRILTRPGPWARVAGLGSIYGKTVRDSRRAALVIGGVAALFMLGTGAPFAAPEFSTIELRRQFIAGLTALPLAVRGLLGEPINLETLGGFLSWRVGNFLPVMLGLWPVLALSGTLAGEAAKGSLDLLASTPQSRPTIALQKLAGHVTAVVFSMLILALSIWGVGRAFGSLPGDEIALTAAFGQVLLYGLMMLGVGGVAFATAPYVGRTRAMAFGLLALFASYLIYSYSSLSPLIGALTPLSFFDWTAGHRPIAGVSDWGSLAFLAGVDVVLFAIGVVAFNRRDIGSVANVGWLRLPSLPAGIGGPFRRQLADRAGVAIAWGLGIGLYGLLVAASAKAFADTIGSMPQIVAIINAIYPGVDLRQPSGVLQLTFFGFGAFVFGLAGASFLGGWASDEGRRRLDVVLSTSRSRASWAARSGLGVLAAIGVVTAIVAAFIAIGVAAQAGDVASPVGGIAVLGLSAAAFAGVGLAAGGLVRAPLAAGVTAFLVIATFLIDTLGTALKLPDAVLQLSLYKHLGQPMAGVFDPVGIVVASVMVIAGVAVCAFGLTRRDIGR
jgi:ABC-2 type transport system permease protein